MRQKSTKKNGSQPENEDSGDPAFDRWVSRQLHRMYDDVLGEEIPPELLEVVDRMSDAAAPAEREAKPEDGIDKSARSTSRDAQRANASSQPGTKRKPSNKRRH